MAGWILALLIVALGRSPMAIALSALPDSISITQGRATLLSLSLPLCSDVAQEDRQVLSSTDESLDGVKSARLTGEGEGTARLVIRLLGVPVKTVSVRVSPEVIVTPGGQTVGVAMQLKGVMVVGLSDIGSEVSPARIAGLKAGDLITEVDGEEVTDAACLTQMLSDGDKACLTVERGGVEGYVSLTPVRDERDGICRMGAWVRDSTAGVGTLSFYNPETGVYAALGHAVTDVDTGSVLSVGEGAVYASRILDVRKGVSGEPGELLGEFFNENLILGDISDNTDLGIYGELYDALSNEAYPQGTSVLSHDEVRLGPATILCTLDDEGVKEYDCEIIKLSRQEEPAQRGIIVEITDPELLERTGGIVQGMSGSPILQDGHLAGAITHVYVNDPTKGYGVYAEWMLTQSDQESA